MVRGDLARSSFYYAVRYKMDIDPIQESHLREWHLKDPVDKQERDRAQLITEEQGNANPFIDDPAAVDRIADF
jgi:endonuclease I